MKMSNKDLLKLRTKYRKFDLTEFDEWYFGQSITTQIAWSRDDFHHYRYMIGYGILGQYLDVEIVLTINGLVRRMISLVR